MASIKIKNLQPAGSDLFNDSESFMNELTESELIDSNGGSPTPTTLIFVASILIVTLM